MEYYDNGSGRRGIFSMLPPVTTHLIIINVIMFVATLINENFMIGTFSMFYPASPFFRAWQPLTHLFMHGGLYAQQWDCWIIRHVYFQFFKESPHCSP